MLTMRNISCDSPNRSVIRKSRRVTIYFLLAIATAAFLTACSGSGGSSEVATPDRVATRVSATIQSQDQSTAVVATVSALSNSTRPTESVTEEPAVSISEPAPQFNGPTDVHRGLGFLIELPADWFALDLDPVTVAGLADAASDYIGDLEAQFGLSLAELFASGMWLFAIDQNGPIDLPDSVIVLSADLSFTMSLDNYIGLSRGYVLPDETLLEERELRINGREIHRDVSLLADPPPSWTIQYTLIDDQTAWIITLSTLENPEQSTIDTLDAIAHSFRLE